MISVESTAETIHIHIPRAEVSDVRLAQLLRGLPLETVAAKRDARVDWQRVDKIVARVHAVPPVRAMSHELQLFCQSLLSLTHLHQKSTSTAHSHGSN